MADETFRPRKPMTEGEPPLQQPQITGNIPPQFLAAMQAAQNQAAQNQNTPVEQNISGNEPKRGFGSMGQGEDQPSPMPPLQSRNAVSSGHLKELLESLKGATATYEEILLPSGGRFYDGVNGPTNGIISIRPMTGEEEQILATPRYVKKGQALNMIFQKCMKENYRAENFLTVDRTYLLIYLRGISYSPSYDVEMKCQECEKKFGHTIDLNTLYVEQAPDDFGPELRDVLPTTKLPFSYRLSNGKDEQEINEYRERRSRAFGDAATDDSLIHRTAMLLNDIDGITNKQELQVLLKNLPINDNAYIRSCINEPPFGVDTRVEIICPNCLQDFEVDLPLEANFFFPRRKKGKTQV